VTGLQEAKLFTGLLSAELKMLEQTSHIRRLKAGDFIFREGDPGDGLYIVNEGLVQISAVVGEQHRRVLARIGPGDFFGEMAVLEAQPRSASASVEQDSTVQFIPSQELMPILERSPKVAVSLLREVSRRMRDLDQQFLRELLQAERLSLVGRFTRSILHDIKGPLTVISMAGEIGCAPSAAAEQRQTSAQRIRKQVDRMNNMINELMEFTKGERSQRVLESIDFHGYLTSLLDEIKLEVRARGVEVVCETPVPKLSLPLDQQRLTNLFFNLIHNALDVLPMGGKILLRFNVTDSELVTEFEDTGPGFAPEIAGRLFEPFATFGKVRGTGLGLSICRKIVEDHGGQIRAISQPDRGAIFHFTLPLKHV
jgi:signal transduction histidine kinase